MHLPGFSYPVPSESLGKLPFAVKNVFEVPSKMEPLSKIIEEEDAEEKAPGPTGSPAGRRRRGQSRQRGPATFQWRLNG